MIEIYEKRWMEKYKQLKQFYKNYGHYCVEKSGKQYKSLGYWVIRQRELRNGKRKNESLLKHREALLDKIGTYCTVLITHLGSFGCWNSALCS